MAKLIKQDLADLIEKAKQQKGSLQEGLDLFVSYIKEAEDSLLELVDGEELSPSQRELYEKLDIATFPGLYQGSQFQLLRELFSFLENEVGFVTLIERTL